MIPGGMKKTALLAAVIVGGVLAVSGCSSATTDEAPAAEQTVTTQTFEPIAPDTTTAAPEPVEGEVDEAEFLDANRDSLRGVDSATDEQLLAAGYEACRQISEGTPVGDVKVFAEPSPEEIVEGYNDENLAGLATMTLCTEYNIVPD